MDIRKGKLSQTIAERFIPIIKITIIGVVVITIVFALNQLNISRYFPIHTVKVYGINRVDQQEVQTTILPFLNNGFFTINVEFIKDRLLQMPWVAHLSVRRVWPDEVDITLTEKAPVAYWNNESILSEGGELFKPRQNSIPKDLIHFIGPVGQQIAMLTYFKDINRLLSPLRVKILSLELTPYFTWKITLDNGIMMQVGYKDILTRLSQFVKVYPKIVGTHETDVDYIDLRYPNGVAVKWKETVKF